LLAEVTKLLDASSQAILTSDFQALPVWVV